MYGTPPSPRPPLGTGAPFASAPLPPLSVAPPMYSRAASSPHVGPATPREMRQRRLLRFLSKQERKAVARIEDAWSERCKRLAQAQVNGGAAAGGGAGGGAGGTQGGTPGGRQHARVEAVRAAFESRISDQSQRFESPPLRSPRKVYSPRMDPLLEADVPLCAPPTLEELANFAKQASLASLGLFLFCPYVTLLSFIYMYHRHLPFFAAAAGGGGAGRGGGKEGGENKKSLTSPPSP